MKIKILVIDDDEDIRELIKFILIELNYEVVTSSSTDIITHVQPDLILIDIFWLEPEKGIKLCKSIKATIKNAKLILLSTVNNLPSIATDCQADDYLEKPFDIDVLTKKVSDALQSNTPNNFLK